MIQLSILFLIFANGVERLQSHTSTFRLKKSTSAEGALCTNLANGNVGNFHSKVQEGTMASRYMRGPVDPISL